MFMSRDEIAAARAAIVSEGGDTGVDVRSLSPGTELVVATCNSRYHLIKLENGSMALIDGGPYFPEATEARIQGAALTGSLLKRGRIEVGLRMEVMAGATRVVTSRVRSIVVHPGGVTPESDVMGSAA